MCYNNCVRGVADDIIEYTSHNKRPVDVKIKK